MKTTTAYTNELLQVYDLVKLTKTPHGVEAKKSKKGRPHGMSIHNIIEFDETKPMWNEHCRGGSFSVMQVGTIQHDDSLNYKLGDEIYAKNGIITTEKTPYKIGRVIPQGIYLDFIT